MSDDESTSSDLAPHEREAISQPVKSRGRGRGRGRGRPKGSTSKLSQSSQPSQPSNPNIKAAHRQKRGIEKLKAVEIEEHLSDSEKTSESAETKRIAKAQKKWDHGKTVGDESDTATSSDEAVGSLSSAGRSSSSVTNFCRWICENVVDTPDQIARMVQRLCETPVTLGEFCAGMCSATMAMTVLEKILQQKTGHAFHVDTVIATEMVTWKAKVCESVCSSCECHPRIIPTTGQAARDVSPTTCAVAVLAIECDDISSCSQTPKGVLDTQGKSGRSLSEFIQYLTVLGHTQRPSIIIVECVSNLHNLRHLSRGSSKSSSGSYERGTTIVTEQFRTLGYDGSWKILNAKSFAVPHSRARVYGIFVKLSCFGQADHVKAMEEVDSMWSFVSKCQRSAVEPLLQFLTKSCGILDSDKRPKRRKGGHKESSARKHVPKWVQEHQKFKEKHGFSYDGALPHISKQILACAAELSLSQREAELGALQLAVTLKKHPDGKAFVANIGDSLRYCHFKSCVHPCLLPHKKYLYVIGDSVAVNTTSAVPFALQGLHSAEVKMFGLDSLSLAEAQDLAGNAFCVNIICAILFAVLLTHDFSAK